MNLRIRERGAAMTVLLHVVLLVLVLGQLVYLASRARLRVDLTSDELWSLTGSTRDILGRLDQRLLVEAYFTPKEKLPTQLRHTREILDNFLDELVQLGKGKVAVQRFDPLEDKTIAEKAQRLGVKPIELVTGTTSSMSRDTHYQGLRFVYGGGKQKVIEQIGPRSSFEAEAAITPAIKEVATATKPKFGFMEWPAAPSQPMGQQAPQGSGWNTVRTFDLVGKRYEFQNYKDEEGALLPAECETLFLFRPKDLTDRQKFVVDQFLMRGGTLVVFADAAEYAVGPRRMMNLTPGFAIDAAGSKHKFVEQLAHYGVEWRTKVVADLHPQACSANPMQGAEYLARMQQNMFGQQQAVPVFYPYFFHPMRADWSQLADRLAATNGSVDAELAERYRRFLPGIDEKEPLFQAYRNQPRGPGFYWPTWVDLRRKAGVPDALDLPPGVEGKVLLRSSPLALVEDPPQSLNPIGGGDSRSQDTALQQFTNKLGERLKTEPRQQAPLMVEVRGAFASFFAGKERPLKGSEAAEAEAAKKKAEEDAKKAEEAKDAPKDDAVAKADEPTPGEKTEAEKSDAKAAETGPQPADGKQDAAKAPSEPPIVEAGTKPGRIVVIGDSDFVRDDFVRGEYAQAGGPVSIQGPRFFAVLVDWIAQDRELTELMARVPTDRTLRILPDDAAAPMDPRQREQDLRRASRAVHVLTIAIPCVLLLGLGLVVFITRRAQKKSFLESVDRSAAA